MATDPIVELRKAEEEIRAEAERKIAEKREKLLAPLREERQDIVNQITKLNARIDEIDDALGETKPKRRRSRTRTSVDRDEIGKKIKATVGDAGGTGINATEVAKKIGAGAQTVRGILSELVESGDVIRAGQRRGTKYFGKPWANEAAAHDAPS